MRHHYFNTQSIYVPSYTCKNLTTSQQDVLQTSLEQACQQVVTMLLLCQVVELQDDNKFLEQACSKSGESTSL